MYKILLSCGFVFYLHGQPLERQHSPTPLIKLLEGSEAVLVGSLGAGRLNNDRWLLRVTAPSGGVPGVRLLACRFDLKVIALITSQPTIKQGVILPLVWYLPSSKCKIDYLDRHLTGPSVWFLRREGGYWRPVKDSLESVRPIYQFDQQLENELRRWNEPKLALAYLFVKPGIVVKEQTYINDVEIGPLLDVVGWSGYLEVSRAVFSSGDETNRNRLCVVQAQFGMCIACAKQAIKSDGLAVQTSQTYLLSDENFQDFERRELDRLLVASKEELGRQFSTLSQAEDELVLYACSSSPPLRLQARKLLERFFQVGASELPCIPCEAPGSR